MASRVPSQLELDGRAGTPTITRKRGRVHELPGLLLARVSPARFSHAEPPVLVSAKKLAARREALAARQVYTAHHAAHHIFGHGFIAGGRRSAGILSAGIAAEPLEQSIDNKRQRDEKQELCQEGVRGRIEATAIITQACWGRARWHAA